MPELPEVETIRMGLEKYIIGHTIDNIEIRLAKMVQGDVKNATGAKIVGVRRFGKGIVIDLDNDYSLAIHIKMTGQLIVQGSEIPKETKVSVKAGGKLPNKHTHVICKLSVSPQRHSGKPKAHPESLRVSRDRGQARMTHRERVFSCLYYNDIRQFGWIKIVQTNAVGELPFFKELGPEPPVLPATEGRRVLTREYFRTLLRKTKSPIKPLLMDQKKISGIGNIYANDALFLAKLYPKRPANSLSEQEMDTLFQTIQQVLQKGIRAGGASEWQYVNALGEAGKYQHFFQVYGRTGKPCVVCRTKIQKIVMAGRGTFFCPTCQV